MMLALTSYVLCEGTNTKTPELKQSGHPASGAAENSSRSKSSSEFCMTRVSASRKTHFVNWTSFQQLSLVKVTPSSGRSSSFKLAASLLSNSSTSTTRSKVFCSSFLGEKIHKAHCCKCKKSEVWDKHSWVWENKIFYLCTPCSVMEIFGTSLSM